jgi:histidine triad (HIT) family protein
VRRILAATALALLCTAPAASTIAPGTTPGSATGLFGAYDDHNAFARILEGTLPATKVYEDGQVLAFMNIHPVSPGDMLLIPKQHVRNLMDIRPRTLQHLMVVAQRLAKAQAAALHPDGIFIRQNSGEVADQTVFHFHLHITPMYAGVALAKTSYDQPPADPAELARIAAQIHAAYDTVR